MQFYLDKVPLSLPRSLSPSAVPTLPTYPPTCISHSHPSELRVLQNQIQEARSSFHFAPGMLFLVFECAA